MARSSATLPTARRVTITCSSSFVVYCAIVVTVPNLTTTVMNSLLVRCAVACFIAASVAACSSSTDVTTGPSDLPVIRGFSHDTVSPGSAVTIYGKNLAFCSAWIGDVKAAIYDSLEYAYVAFMVPPRAQTDYVFVSNDGVNKVRSPKPLVVISNQPSSSFRISNVDKSTATAGGRIAIYGSKLLAKKDSLSILFNNLLLPIDAVYDDSIIVHLPSKSATGYLQVIYQNSVFANFSITIVRPLVWRHMNVKIVGFEYTSYHRRTGYSDYQKRTLDTSWYEHTTLNDSWTFDLPVTSLSPSGSQFSLSTTLASKALGATLQFNLTWDTVQQYTQCWITFRTQSQSIMPVSISQDTLIAFNTLTTRTSLNADSGDSLMFPFSAMSYQPQITLTHSESDHNGEYSWTESSTVNPNSNLGVGRLIIELTP
jgi:hypothetical protein